ncbi:16S rRNA (cytosine(967)-C(5))-methyltransferase [Snodgrassella communis]|uniref:16S rRNA (cytosine(967)-C(5))-methyltransferase n=1 Tax=Snodgrassella communis TaxID=2946699 RepID=A0A836MN18_9NEIS|nr:16S rRNA (cytosine(967)-C(5))-methyltransferase RsmB [Snodgrassella communis]KDN13911.1 Ribosomal RNA small subunit methyltransferase B [Snodgrassella communis]PIT10538.1 16S rRNA (cytosine(967)-C(5))-methyltransferase [Snodgrassella communis]PIT25927.1 16S rRNA (cytosine(967)-C(5))-methyltransferase [Snodgrassella communis]PIT30649.1 16S rRNA (cytosine(967)-C(5))-methyltransferase [Snodgrassella communis]PIT34893.1 16S rRNA (cytosine(967)-C(5))-methyltransferase [Snodgrassella communis]
MSMAHVQQLAAHAIGEVLNGRNLSEVLVQLMQQHPELSVADKGALHDLSHGSLRHLGLLQQLVHQMTKTLPPIEIVHLLVIALYQLHFTRNAAHAVVNEAVNYARQLQGGHYQKLINALLRRFLRERETLLACALKQDEARYNLPAWWLNYLKKHYPQHWHNMVTAMAQHPPMTLRINRRYTDAEQYLAKLTANGIAAKILDTHSIMLQQAIVVQRLPNFAAGHVSVQDFGAQQAIPLLNPQNGERILDACAAPGGKTGHILEWADCDVTALDIDPLRLKRVQDNLQRLQQQAHLHCADAKELHLWYDNNTFDAILADVPCTASGVIKRHPDIKWLRQPQDSQKTALQQEALLDSLWLTLKSGGRLLLATCSIFMEENQQQLTRFLTRHADACERQSRVLLPNSRQDGFFYALIDKI